MSSSTDSEVGIGQDRVELTISGMTCASCAARIEKRLNKLDGVVASVNYSTEKARIDFPPGISADDLVAVVEKAGYSARLPEPPRSAQADGVDGDPEDSAVRPLRHRLLVSLALTLPVVAMAMIPPLQFTNWQWLSLTLAAPVVVWGGWSVPPRRLDESAAPHVHDGHPHLDGHPGRARVVAVRIVLRHRRRAGNEA
ncbi:MAG: cation transporter [Geodermatophilaceae bacterium]